MAHKRHPYHHHNHSSLQPVHSFKAVLVNTPIYPAACRYQFKTFGCKFKHNCRYAHYSFAHEYQTTADAQQIHVDQQLKALSEQVKELHDMVKRMGHTTPSERSDSPPSPITAALSFDTRQMSTTSPPPKLRSKRNKPKAKNGAAQQQQLRSTPIAVAPKLTQSQAKSTRSKRPPQSTSNATFAKKILNALSIDDDVKIVTAAPTTTTAQTICASATSLSENAQTQTQMQTDLSETQMQTDLSDLQPTFARNSTLRIDDIDVSSDDERKKFSPRNSTDSSDVPHSLSLKSVPPPTTTTTTLALKPIAQRTTQSVAKTDCDEQSRLTAIPSGPSAATHSGIQLVTQLQAHFDADSDLQPTTSPRSSPKQRPKHHIKQTKQHHTKQTKPKQTKVDVEPELILTIRGAIPPPTTSDAYTIVSDIQKLPELLDSPLAYVDLGEFEASAGVIDHSLGVIRLSIFPFHGPLTNGTPKMPKWSGCLFNGKPLTFSTAKIVTTRAIQMAALLQERREAYAVSLAKRVAEQKMQATMLPDDDFYDDDDPYSDYNDDSDPYESNTVLALLTIECESISSPQQQNALQIFCEILALRELSDSPLQFVSMDANATIQHHKTGRICVRIFGFVREDIMIMSKWSGTNLNGKPMTFSVKINTMK